MQTADLTNHVKQKGVYEYTIFIISKGTDRHEQTVKT